MSNCITVPNNGYNSKLCSLAELESQKLYFEEIIGKLKNEITDLKHRTGSPFEDKNENKYTSPITDTNRLYMEELVDFVDNGPMGLQIVGKHGRIKWSNKKNYEMLGYTVDEYIGRQFCDFFDDQSVIGDIFNRLLNKENLKDEQLTALHKDGSRRYILLDSNDFCDEFGNFAYARCFIRDITEKYLAEQKLIQLNKEREIAQLHEQEAVAANKLKSTFLAKVSHEVRTPLNAVIGMARILGSTELTEIQKEFVQDIESSAQLLLTLINDILDFSKVDAGCVELENISFDLEHVIMTARKLVLFQANNKQIPINVVCTPEFNSYNKYFLGDPNRLTQIFLNLCSNAVKFTDSGQIDIIVKIQPFSVEDSLDNGKSLIHIAIKDTGIGIGDVSKLFVPFMQANSSISRRFGGTGLGLNISRSLVELMGGKISLSSAEGVGTTADIYLVLDNAVCQNDISLRLQSDAVNDQNMCELNVRILVAEDNILNQKVLKHMFKSMNFDVNHLTIVNNGFEAIAEFRNSIQNNAPFKLCLMDCEMPECDGYEATSTIRQIEAELGDKDLPRLPICAVTANAYEKDRLDCYNAGMDEFITKPILVDKIKEMIYKWAV